MSRIGWLDLPSGIAGDMFLGSLIGAGADPQRMEQAVQAVAGPRVRLAVTQEKRGGLTGTRVQVLLDDQPLEEGGGPRPDNGGAVSSSPSRRESTPKHRTHQDIQGLLHAAPLADGVRRRALAVFQALAEAEAEVHGTTPGEVHFHEVGSWDAMADVVGAAAGLDELVLSRLFHGPVAVGGGVTRSAHGELPVPAPATLRLLADRPCVFEPGAGELTTPTGAALLRALAEPAPSRFSLHPERTGYGAGRYDPAHRPNLVRLVVGRESRTSEGVEVGVIEATLDDATPEEGGDLIARLLEAGAWDATLTPTLMKKSRPGFLLRAVAAAGRAEEFAQLVTRLSPSLGARWRVENRVELARRTDVVVLPEGEVRVKVGILPGGGERPHPEHDDIAAVARARDAALAEVRREVERRWAENR